MKQDIKNKELRLGRKAYVPASVKVINFTTQRVLCLSNQKYEWENNNPWA